MFRAKVSNNTKTEKNIKNLLSSLEEGCSHKQLIGHSFGARFLENALAQSLVGQINTALQLDFDKDMNRVVSSYEQFMFKSKKLEENIVKLNSKTTELKDQTKKLKDTNIEFDKQIKNLQGKIAAFENDTNYLKLKNASLQGVNAIKLKNIKMKYDSLIDKFSNEEFKDCRFPIESNNLTFLSKMFPEYPIDLSMLNIASFYNDSYDSIIRIMNFKSSNESKLFKEETICSIDDELNNFLEIQIDSTNLDKYIETQIDIVRDWIRLSDNLHVKNAQYNSKLQTVMKNKDKIQDDIIETKEKIFATKLIISKNEDELKTLKKNNIRDFMKLVKVYERTLSPPADLILLINPATEAISANMLSHSFCKLKDFNLPKLKPWIVSIASRADIATKWAFPLYSNGKLLLDITGSKPRSYNDSKNFVDEICSKNNVGQWDLISHTAPFVKELQTHKYQQIEGKDIDKLGCKHVQTRHPLNINQFWSEVYNSPKVMKLIGNEKNKNKYDKVYIGSVAQRYFTESYSCSGVSKEDVVIFSDNIYLLVSVNENIGDEGYWSIEVSKNFMKGHNDIFNQQIGSLIYQQMMKGDSYNICSNLSNDDSKLQNDEIKNEFYRYCKGGFVKDFLKIIEEAFE